MLFPGVMDRKGRRKKSSWVPVVCQRPFGALQT